MGGELNRYAAANFLLDFLSVLMCADLINESFLRQSAFSEIDRYCSVERQIAMMQMITAFIESSKIAIDMGISLETISALPVMRRLMRMGEEIAEDMKQTRQNVSRILKKVFEQTYKKVKRWEPDKSPFEVGKLNSYR